MCMRSMIAVAAIGLAMGTTAVGQKPQYPDYPSETPEHFQAPTAGMDYDAARGDDPDARRREAAHGDPVAEGREAMRGY